MNDLRHGVDGHSSAYLGPPRAAIPMCYIRPEQRSMRKEGTTPLRLTSADLDAFPDDGKRYEIIDGELYVSKQPHFYHQRICTRILMKLQQWSEESGQGEAVIAPGLIFAEDDDVAPDVVWVSSGRMAAILGADGKFHAAPE